MSDKVLVEDVDFRINQISEKVLMGPQAEVLEKINIFNETFSSAIGVTKTFRWSPGIYDKIKELLHREVFQWDKRCNKVESLFNRIEERGYRQRQIKDRLTQIDSDLRQKRAMGVVFQENREEIREYFNLFIGKMIAFSEYNHDNISVNIEFDMQDVDYFNGGEMIDIVSHVDVIISMDDMHLQVWDSNDGCARDIGDIQFPYDISLEFKFSFVKWFNSICAAIQNDRDITHFNQFTSNSYWIKGMAIDRSEYCNSFLIFPYISRHHSRGTTVCLGDFLPDVMIYLMNLNPDMFYDIMYRWATLFIVNKTHPYNGISYAFHGHPKGISNDDLMILQGSGDSSDCRYPREIREMLAEEGESVILKDSYCDRSECQWREHCKFYKEKVLGDAEIKPTEIYQLDQNQRSSPMPSWMRENEDGTFTDTRPMVTHDSQTYDPMQVESDMVSNDGERTTQYLEENDPEAIQPMPGNDEQILSEIDDFLERGHDRSDSSETVEETARRLSAMEEFDTYLRTVDPSDSVEEEGEAPF
jgi:hypothetical protein